MAEVREFIASDGAAKKIVEHASKRAENIKFVSTSQSRNVYGSVKKLEMTGLSEKTLRQLLLLKPRLAYARARIDRRNKDAYRHSKRILERPPTQFIFIIRKRSFVSATSSRPLSPITKPTVGSRGNSPMQTEKLSVSLPAPLVQFVEQYKQSHQRKNRSEVIEEAIELLRQRELEQAYREASREVDPAWEATTADGLADEAW